MERPLNKLVDDINKSILKYFTSHLEHYGLGSGQFGILYEISMEKGISQDIIARRRNVDKSSIGKSIQKLIKQGYVYKKIDNNDKRAYCLYCTEEGEELIPFIKELIANADSIMTADFTDEEVVLLEKMFRKIISNFSEHF